MRLLTVVLCVILLYIDFIKCFLANEETEDISKDAKIFQSKRLPSSERLYPSVGNGHIGYIVHGDTVFINGVYNGEAGLSHRARVPAFINIMPTDMTQNCQTCTYNLNVEDGIYKVSIKKQNYTLKQRIFAHKYYTRALVIQIVVEGKVPEPVELNFGYYPGKASTDINFQPAQHTSLTPVQNHEILYTCGSTYILENSTYQTEGSNVCVYWTKTPEKLTAFPRKKTTHTYVMSIDQNKAVAKKELMDILSISDAQILQTHKREWRNIWRTTRIDVEGNLALGKVIYGSLYYLLNSLPSTNTNQRPNMFFGLSPGGLARGNEVEDYEGHSFWDTETWMYPPILLLHPDLALQLLQYRVNLSDTASDLANEIHYKGIRFPWESAFTGVETTQPCCPEVAEFQHHITGCIAFAFRQYLATGNNSLWIQENGCRIIYKMADFWASRTHFNESTKLYDINRVMGPDEDHMGNNSAFTNVIAGLALYLGKYATCLCNDEQLSLKANKWIDIARHLKLPYDEETDYHPQFDGYERGTRIKQADAVLLGYPLQYSMRRSTRKNDLLAYENVTRKNGPAMTWGMHSIGHLDLDEILAADDMFNKSFTDYIRQPFKIWNEYRKPYSGAVNFLTGMGGFLQAVINGYAGIRINLDGLYIRKPRLPPQTSRLIIKGIKYKGYGFNLDIQGETETTIQFYYVNPDIPLALYSDDDVVPILESIDQRIILKKVNVLKPITSSRCPFPEDIIGIKKES